MMPENVEEDMDDVLFSLPVDFQDFDQEVVNQEANVVEAGIMVKRGYNHDHNPKGDQSGKVRFRQDCKNMLQIGRAHV